MAKEFYQQDTRLAEARPDLMATQQRIYASREDDNDFSGFGTGRSKPIVRDRLFVANTSEIETNEADAVLSGVRKLLDEIQSRIVVAYSGDLPIGEGEYGNADWYQENALMHREKGFGQQVNAYKLDHIMRIEPQQMIQPHFDLMVLDKDLTTAFLGNDFIYGLVKYPNSLLSVCRLRGKFEDYRVYLALLSLIGAQQTARLMGLSRRNFNEKGDNHFDGYCNGEKGPCLMEPLTLAGNDPEEQVDLLAGEVNWLCEDCLEEAEYRRKDLQRKDMIW